MSHLILLGDSTFDNAAYVRGGLTVIDQVRRRPPEGLWATLNAMDGRHIEGIHRQLDRLPGDASHLILSVGDNDIFRETGVLGSKVTAVGEGVRLLADIRDRFERDYARLLRAIEDLGRPTVLHHLRAPGSGMRASSARR